MKGPILKVSEYEYLGIVYPWHVFKPRRKGVPELRYLAAARLLYDNEELMPNDFHDDLESSVDSWKYGTAIQYYKPLLPKEEEYITSI